MFPSVNYHSKIHTNSIAASTAFEPTVNERNVYTDETTESSIELRTLQKGLLAKSARLQTVLPGHINSLLVPMKPGLGEHMFNAAQQHASELQERDAAQLGNRGPEIDIVLWTLTSISLLFLVLRLYCKSYRHKDLWWDDWILILSWVRHTKYPI